MNNWARGSNTIRCRTAELCWTLRTMLTQFTANLLSVLAIQTVWQSPDEMKKFFPRCIQFNSIIRKMATQKIIWVDLKTSIFYQLLVVSCDHHFDKTYFFRRKNMTRKIWAQKFKSKLEFYVWRNQTLFLCIFAFSAKFGKKHVLRKCEKAYCTKT